MRGREILALLLVILVGITYPVVFIIVVIVLVIIAIRAAAKKEEQKYLEIELELKKQQQEEERKKQEKRIMGEYIVRYLANRELKNNARILECHRRFGSFFRKDSLYEIVKQFETILADVEQESRAAASSREMDEALSTKEMCEALLGFLDDLEKFYKLFHKKGLHTDYLELMELFAEAVEHDINKEYDNYLMPIYERISKRAGENITVESIVQEFLKTSDTQGNSNTITKLLDKFGLQYNQEDLEKIIGRIREDIELEEFEQNLDSLPKTAIGDFEKLTGYEFETYLKELFGLLGYTVIQTSLSGDQGADLILSKDGKKMVVQAKKYHGKVSNKAIQEIVAAKNHYQVDEALVVTDSSFTRSAIALALSNDVELWDGLKLKDVIRSLKDKRQETKTVTISPTFQEGKDIQNIKIPCPFCNEEFEYEVDVSEKVDFEVKCLNCAATLSRKGVWNCKYCSKEFDAEEEVEEHEKTCRKQKA